jgi:hypothetical protein
VLQTPYPATHYLREIKGLRDEGGVAWGSLDREKDWHKRETYATLIVIHLGAFNIRHTDVFPTISLVKETVNAPVELWEGTRGGFETKGHVECGVSCRFYQDAVGQS